MTNKGDLISREALRKEVTEKVHFTTIDGHIAYDEMLKLIDNSPTVPVLDICKDCKSKSYNNGLNDGIEINKRPQGKWIRYKDEPHQPEHIKCSNCGQYWSIADHDKTFDFCFKCGADMRGGEES